MASEYVAQDFWIMRNQNLQSESNYQNAVKELQNFKIRLWVYF